MCLYIGSITRFEGHKTILKVRTLSSVPQVILQPRDCGLFLMQKFLPLKEMISSAGNCQCKRYLEFDTEGMVHPVSSDKMAFLQWRTQNALPLVTDGIHLQFMWLLVCNIVVLFTRIVIVEVTSEVVRILSTENSKDKFWTVFKPKVRCCAWCINSYSPQRTIL